MGIIELSLSSEISVSSYWGHVIAGEGRAFKVTPLDEAPQTLHLFAVKGTSIKDVKGNMGGGEDAKCTYKFIFDFPCIQYNLLNVVKIKTF